MISLKYLPHHYGAFIDILLHLSIFKLDQPLATFLRLCFSRIGSLFVEVSPLRRRRRREAFDVVAVPLALRRACFLSLIFYFGIWKSAPLSPLARASCISPLSPSVTNMSRLQLGSLDAKAVSARREQNHRRLLRGAARSSGVLFFRV